MLRKLQQKVGASFVNLFSLTFSFLLCCLSSPFSTPLLFGVTKVLPQEPRSRHIISFGYLGYSQVQRKKF